MIEVIFPDGKGSYPEGVTAGEVLKNHGSKDVTKKTVAAQIDGMPADLSTPQTVEAVTLDSKEGLDIYRHSTAHIMAQAVKSLYKEAKLGMGPAIEDGFYYDFDVAEPFTPGYLATIEKKMKEIIKGNFPFKREVLKRDEAIRLFKEMGEDYKAELAAEIDS